MKKILLFALTILLLLGMVGCFGSPSKNEIEPTVLEFIKEYKTKQYTVEDPGNPPSIEEIGEKVKPYLSNEVYEKQNINRTFDIPAKVAAKTNSSIEVKDVALEKIKSDENSTKYKYTVQLVFDNGSSSETVEKKGELTITNGDEPIITRDWENRNSQIGDVKF